MSRVVFVTGSRSRRPEFQINTTALRNDHQIVFRKSAASSSSKGHIEKIAQTYQSINQLADNDVGVVRILNNPVEDGFIDFEYINGVSLEKQLLDTIINKDGNAAIQVVEKWIALLRKMSNVNESDHKHTYNHSMFGPDIFGSFPGSQCVRPGLLDSNLDNVIQDKSGKLTLIDFEWCYDHCLPFDYLLARGIVWFGVRHAKLLSLHSDRLDLVSFGESIVLPRKIAKKYLNERSVRAVQDIEWGFFQKYVTGMDFNDRLSQDFGLRETVTKPRYAIERLDTLEQANVELSRYVHELGHEINSIRASRAYKLAQKIRKAKQKISIKKR